ncbi:cyclic pyranopterin monophosphate synthase subunit MoaA [Chitinophaga niastensis]|uniref:GTP 3',8-cyclase n=1 Tax=Chitinophaga niastensis TaxID=536980 RepID=A0A2P8HUA6_CHINA|nr:GTP 3',8-cyclase MoaA [Chitinophaga niastensis]PSL49798.1 cyclic pyranopterin monophosphate synthase subunit MoaA [Chitinophaga niastensis]
MLTDAHHRIIDYVRLSVTDRCNLRCTYCMPEDMHFVQKNELLTDNEILTLLQLLAGTGISKVRITGGEPFLRAGLMTLLEKIKNIPGIREIAITTNGILTQPHISALRQLGITNINLSLDTLQADRFLQITRRNKFATVMATLESLLQHNMQVKINAVVMENVNTDELTAFTALTRENALSVRFIEEMPFNGQGHAFSGITWNYHKILETISSQYALQKISDAPHSTSLNYHIPGHKGNIGVIPAYSRTFCGTCNRLRISATGSMKTCLYGNDVLNVKEMMRDELHHNELLPAIQSAIHARFANGFEAEQHHTAKNMESMSVIGG